MLRAGWQASAGFDFADDGRSGTGRRPLEDSGSKSEPRARSARRGSYVRSQRVLPRGWGSGDRGARLRHANHPPCSKIVGPGNLFVTVAKKLVSFDCAIDFLAGPTEVVILSDRGRAEFIAADLVAQAEHDTAALPIFITTSKDLANSVRQIVSKVRNNVAAQSLRRNGAVLLAKDRQEAIAWANRIAPEHITVEQKRPASHSEYRVDIRR